MRRDGDRVVLWLPVLFAVGIAAYFGARIEPPLWLGAVSVLVTAVAVICLRRVRFVLWLALGLTMAGLGFTVVQLRSHALDTVTMTRAAWTSIEGHVELIERRLSDARLTLGNVRLSMTRYGGPPPTRVRVTWRGREPELPTIGDRVRLRARLRPPPPPTAPGAFDFQRHAYFQGIGAVGFTVGAIEVVRPHKASARASITEAVNRTRAVIARRLREQLPNPTGAVAAAMLVGDRAGIDETTWEALRTSGLAHLLAISGLHMGLVAGTVFVTFRLLLAAIPAVALRYPIKKWAALAALFAAAVYLVLAGAPVPTQRAFVMTGAVLVAVLLDREAISLRLVAIAAFGVLAVAPESLAGPSFQLSFAAVVALVAVYEVVAPWRRRWVGEDRPGPFRRAAFYIGGVMLTSLVAAVVTAPIVAHHFQQVPTVGVVANLAAVPLTAFVTMPAGVLALVLMPLGLEAWPLTLMGEGIDATLDVAATVLGYAPEALATSPLPGGGLAAMALGGAWLAIWRQPWRMLGAIGVLAGGVHWFLVPVPDALVDGEGRLIAVRAEDGWAVSDTRGAGFVRRSWARRWAVESQQHLESKAVCDGLGCVFVVAERRLAVPTSPEAAIEDCARADVVVTIVRLRQACAGPSVVVDRAVLRRGGAHAVYLRDDPPWTESVLDFRGIRPWTRNRDN